MKHLLIIVLFLLYGILYGQDESSYVKVTNTSELINKIKEMSEATKTIESDFTQEKHLSMLEEVIISKGYFCYKKENNIRWEYIEPIKYLIIIHDGIFTINDGIKIQKYDTKSNKIFKEINDIIVNSVQGNILNNPQFVISYFENNNYFLAKLIPNKKEMSNFITCIEIYFDKNNFSVSKIKMIEPADDFTCITFTNKKLNEEVPDTKFFAN
ncbi:MAG: outer membrane lipoprotein carrier protein LolA [Bacteroidales bacterium]|nr:outer membrane lipoprotein carrier protein LolA [Bacteroidales bacterium]